MYFKYLLLRLSFFFLKGKHVSFRECRGWVDRGPWKKFSRQPDRAKVLEQFDPKGDTMNINGRLCSFARRGLYTWILDNVFLGFCWEKHTQRHMFFLVDFSFSLGCLKT